MPYPHSDISERLALERTVDQLVHLIGLVAAMAGIGWLISRFGRSTTDGQVAATAVYGFGLVAMLGASAAYNSARPGLLKARLRTLDHAMIFVMIAGSYTPFAICALKPIVGLPLCILV